jgi:DNA-binding LacI/PurR family transcriptional regulator
MPRMREIAERAGTSLSTVSLVLNNRDSAIGISQATRERVLAAARELGYTPNLAARRLRSSGGTHPLALGLVAPFDDRLPLMVSSSIGAIRSTADTWTAMRQLPHADILIETYPAGEIARLHSLHANARYNGALLFNTVADDDAYLRTTAALALPVVAVQRSIPGLRCVDVDNHTMGREVAAHLLAHGHRHFALISPAIASQAITARIGGFSDALAAAGHPLHPDDHATCAFTADGGAAAVKRLLARWERNHGSRPTALFVAADTIAVGAVHALKIAGVRLPDDMAIIGYDNDPAAAYIDPPLTTVDGAMSEATARATRWLLDAIHGAGAPPQTELLETHLIVRESCGHHPAHPAGR